MQSTIDLVDHFILICDYPSLNLGNISRMEGNLRFQERCELRMRKIITFLNVLLVAALLLGMVPLGAFRTEAYAATADGDGTTGGEAASFDVKGSKTASPTELKPGSLETTVTLSLPSAEYKNEADIIFVMDNSTSIFNSGLDFSGAVQELLDDILAKNPGIDLKIGVVKFRGYATNMLDEELVKYDDSSKDTIIAAIANNDVPGSGSNVHSGLVMADSILEKDSMERDS